MLRTGIATISTYAEPLWSNNTNQHAKNIRGFNPFVWLHESLLCQADRVPTVAADRAEIRRITTFGPHTVVRRTALNRSDKLK